MEQADAHGADSLSLEPPGELEGVLLVQGFENFARCGDSLFGFPDPLGADQRVAWLCEQGSGVIGLPRAVRAADFEQVAEPARDDEAQVLEAALQDGVRRHRRAVEDAVHHGGADFGLRQDFPDALDEALAEVGGRRRRLGGEDLAGVGAHADHVGERAARVDADAKSAFGGHGLRIPT